MQFLPFVFVPTAELRYAAWSEFDFDDRLWRIPAERMKMRTPHLVPLAPQVVRLLQDFRGYTGDGRLVFPSIKNREKPIAPATMLHGLRGMGYRKDELCVHGFRSIASTLLNELGFNRDWIERQLAHHERDGVRAAYNYAEYLPQRRKMMDEWASYLEELKEKARPLNDKR